MREDDAARARLTSWAAYNGWGGAAVGLRRIDGGWLGWVTREPTDDPATGDGLRLLLNPDDTVDSWPAWPLAEIESRWSRSTPEDRFPPYVQAVLETAGWFPGRRLDDEVLDAFAAEMAVVPDLDPPLVLHPAARTALAEFGGLVLEAPLRTPVQLAPVPGHRWQGTLVDALTEVYGQRVCLIGRTPDAELVMAEAGWVLATTGGDSYRAGVDVDTAISTLLTLRGPLPEVVFDD